MTGSLLVLSANSVGQETYLTGNPQITFFKSVYKKYSNYAKNIQKIPITSIKLGQETTIPININGSLISNMYLHLNIPELISTNNNETWKGYVNAIGYNIIEKIELKIGGTTIDKIDSQWLDIYNELYNQKSDCLVGKFNSDLSLQENSSAQRVYIPLPFWFTKNPGLAFPICALTHHEMQLIVKFRSLNEIVKSNISNLSVSPITLMGDLIVNYIQLDNDEEIKFKKMDHEYLIEQLNIETHSITNTTTNTFVNLDRKHPIKELIWIILDNINHTQNIKTGNNWLSYTSNTCNFLDTFKTASISLEGNKLIEEMYSDYYRNITPYEVYNYIPRKHIYSYSFSLTPTNNVQPSGACNFSNLTTKKIEFNFETNSNKSGSPCNGNIKIYLVNYNIITIKNGIFSQLYS